MKAIGYVRVSTEDQAKEGISLEAQEARIRAYALCKDLELVEIIRDEGRSAKDLNRPGLQYLIDKLVMGEVDTLIAYKLDRLFRSTTDALETIKNLKTWGVALHLIVESVDTDSAFGQFFFTITAAYAELERKIIGERTKMALDHIKGQGKVYGPVPYGWMREGDKLVPSIYERELQALAKGMRKKGMSLRFIANNFNEKEFSTKNGGKWYPMTVKKLLDGGEVSLL